MIAGDRRVLRDIATWTALGIAFAVAHTQAPLYFSNQHQYFLHGKAQAGVGDLGRDWLATTVDPTPVFSAFVEFTELHLDEVAYQIVFFALIVTYFFSLMGIGSSIVTDGPKRRTTLFALAVLLIVAHSGIARYASARLLGVDYPWFVQTGLAGQYALGPGLQPSSFGVLLLASAAVFAHGRSVLAIFLLSAACAIHPTYLLAAALLTVAYMRVLRRTSGDRAAFWHGALALALVAPSVIYSATTFSPTSPGQFRESQQIICDFRIPHHTKFARWFDLVAGLQIAWIALAIGLSWGTRLFALMLIPSLLSVCLSLLQLTTGNATLALLFPWRVSVVLVPLATTVIFTRIAALIPAMLVTHVVGWVLVCGAVAGGVVIMAKQLAYGPDDRERPALEFVRDHKQPGDVYLIPVRVPPITPGPRGVFSASFMPPAVGTHQTFISVDLQRFRLFTGACLYVDYKSIPYKDIDVLEWKRRLDQTVNWYNANEWSNPETRKDMRVVQITHVLILADQPELGDGYKEIYADKYYRVYQILE
jgi:Domain of unknown function (DUF6798)